MDEIDAALDFKNVSIIADYIKKRTKDAQFIIISLRNNMFDLANKLIGVYKTSDKTKMVNLEPAKLLRNQELKEKENTDREKGPSLIDHYIYPFFRVLAVL
jgi:structural maintenance of chromosome 4